MSSFDEYSCLKASYGSSNSSQNRINLCELSNSDFKEESGEIQKLARSIGCLVESKYIEKKDNAWQMSETFLTSKDSTLEEHLKSKFSWWGPKSIDVFFQKEPCLAKGTAFLIAPDLALTAGHCFFEEEHPYGLQKFDTHPLLVFNFLHKPELNDKKYTNLTFETQLAPLNHA